MGETKHTPGPWKTAYSIDSGFEVRGGDPLQIVALMPGSAQEWDGFRMHKSECHDLCKADSRLIAAAPDLLEACENIKSYLSHGEGDEPNGLRLISAIELLNAAIAKAKQ